MKNYSIKNIISILLLSGELLLIYFNRDFLVNELKFLNENAVNNYDDILVSIIGALILSVMQFINILAINFLFDFSRKFVIHIVKNRLKIHNYLDKMLGFVFSTKCKWGVSKNSLVLKNANTAEGLIACANAMEAGISLPNDEKRELKKVLERVITDIETNGYKSYNQEAYTVHCTGMVLFAIKKYIDLDIIELDEKQSEKIEDCLKNLLKNANDIGWGFKNELPSNENYNRNFSTIWALRALNAWGFCEHKTFKSVIINMINHSHGILGFSKDSTEKYTITAMMYILVSEIKNIKIKQLVWKNIDEKKVLNYLIKGLTTEVEVEEFITEVENSRKLPWTHLSECLVLEALLQNFNKLNTLRIIKVSVALRNTIKKIDENQGYYIVRSMNFKYCDPFFYPTAYLISSVSAFLSKNND